MKVILTQKAVITSKKGETYTIYRGLGKSGVTIELFLNETDKERFEIPASKVMTEEVLNSLFETAPVVDVEFDQRGRVVSVESGE